MPLNNNKVSNLFKKNEAKQEIEEISSKLKEILKKDKKKAKKAALIISEMLKEGYSKARK